jgi:predicted chitinase
MVGFSKNLMPMVKNNVKLITKAVNGGGNGLAERQQYFNEIKKIWGLN